VNAKHNPLGSVWCDNCGPICVNELAEGEHNRMLGRGLCDKCVAEDASDQFWKWAMIVAALVLALICITLGGCTQEEPRRYEINDIENMEAPGPEIHDLKVGFAQVFHLNDGTRCVTLLSNSGHALVGGLVCQWKEFKEVDDTAPTGLLYEGEKTIIKRPQ
jgi:hypothetical protein